jgi:hypothetical protein
MQDGMGIAAVIAPMPLRETRDGQRAAGESWPAASPDGEVAGMLFDAPGADRAPPVDVLDGGVRPESGALPVPKKCCRADADGIYTSGK